MFIVSTHRNLGITNVNQVPNIYIAENRAITVYFRDNDSQYVIYSDPENNEDRLYYVFDKIVEHIVNNKNCYIHDIVQEYNAQNGG